MKWEVI